MTSIHEVAALAGVSTATVSRVLSDSSHPVKASTRQRVLDAASQLDFQPNRLASGLARRRIQVVAVIVHDMMDEYFSEIARGIEDAAYANGYVTLICNTDRSADKEVHYLRKLRSMRVDAVILTAGGLRDPQSRADIAAQLALLEQSGSMIVHLAPHGDGQPDVGFSNQVGLQLAVDHLVELGHTRIGFLRGPEHIETAEERLAAMHDAMARRGLTLDPSANLVGGFSRDDGERAASAFVAAGCPASAVVCANDQAAIGFLRGLRERGITVPDDVSIVGYDDIAPCHYVEPALTTVHVPLHDLGSFGMRVALELLGGSERQDPIQLPLSLTVRSSTAPAEDREAVR